MAEAYKTIFADGRQNFFRPLNGPWRAVHESAMVRLYDAFFGPRADLSHAVDREKLKSIFLDAVQVAPYLGSDGEEEEDRLLRSKDEAAKVSEMIRRARHFGWIESSPDPVTQREMFRFTQVGKAFAQTLAEFDKPQLRMRQRNVRNTYNNLAQYERDGDPYDLFTAAEHAQRIVHDLADDEAEIREMRQKAVLSAAHDAVTQGYIDYMTKRFMPDHAIRMRVDNANRFASGIRRLIGAVWSKPSDEIDALERAARAARPDLQTEGPLLKTLFNEILTHLDDAMQRKMPRLIEAIGEYGDRVSFIAIQASIVNAMSTQHTIGQFTSALKQLPQESQDEVLLSICEAVGSTRLGLIDESIVRLYKGGDRASPSAVQEQYEETPEERRHAYIRRAIDIDFGVALTDFRGALRAKTSEAAKHGRPEIRLSDLPVEHYQDILLVTHAAEAAATGNPRPGDEGHFDIETTGRRVQNGPLELEDLLIKGGGNG
ncbi:MAG: Wadjet anti-phage system protein JetA family protein [Methanocella sp.]